MAALLGSVPTSNSVNQTNARINRIYQGIGRNLNNLNNRNKNKKSKQNHQKTERDCFCCSRYSRNSRDREVEDLVLKKAPHCEWTLYWDAESLPNSTGSLELSSYAILRHIFLFLPLRMETLLNIAAVNRSWRILSDRLPHWRYLLPLRNEVVSVMTQMKWGDVEFQKIENRVEKDFAPFDDERVLPGEEPHYKLKMSKQIVEYINSGQRPKHYSTKKLRPRRTTARPTDPNFREKTDCKGFRFCCACCDSSSCDCGCSSCSFDSEDDHKEIENILIEKHRKFESDMKSDAVLQFQDDEEKELVQYVFADPQDEVDFFSEIRIAEREKRRQERLEKIALKENKKKNDNNNNKKKLKGRAHHRPRRARPSAAAAAAASQPLIDDDSDKSSPSDEGDDEYETDEDDVDIGSSSDDSSLGIGQQQNSFGVDDDDNSPTQQLTVNPAVAPITLGTVSSQITNKNDVYAKSGNTVFTSSYRQQQEIPIAVSRTTLITNTTALMKDKELRRKYMFPSLSSYLNTVRQMVDVREKKSTIDFWEKYANPISFITPFFILMVLFYLTSGLIGLFIDKTVFESGTDQAVARNISAIVISAFVFFAIIIASALEDILDDYTRPASTTKILTIFFFSYALILLSIPLSLLTTRIRTAEIILESGEVSICDAFSTLPAATTALSEFASRTLPDKDSSLAQDNQCQLPDRFKPTPTLAEKSFVRFPAGTKFLYHPPQLKSRIVPFAFKREDENATICNLTINAEIPKDDFAFNQTTRLDVNRGEVGYYTVILPSASCPSGSTANGITNNTFIIIGDFNACPFWSSAEKTSSSLSPFLHPRFTDLLATSTAAQTETEARQISEEFGDIIANISSSSATSTNCSNDVGNMLVTVSSGNPHDFYLRVAKGFETHWSASYYLPRLPYDPKEGGPWASRPYWKDTAEYNFNGIVALLADWKIFINHKNSASPVVPENFGNSADANAFKNSEKTGGTWSDEGMAPFWSAATPAGIRRLKHDFTVGAIWYTCVMFFLFFFVSGLSVFSWGEKRGWIMVSVVAVLLLIGSCIPLLIQAIICFQNAAPDDSLELTQPVACLQASEVDSKGVLIFASVFAGMYFIGITCGLLNTCCEDEMDALGNGCCTVLDNCCDFCGDHFCCCCGDLCDDCSSDNCCCDNCCCDCLDVCCDKFGDCAGKCCSVICCDSD